MRKIFIFIILIFFSEAIFAQAWKLTRYEATIGIGSANFFGNIGGAKTESNLFGLKDIQLLKTRPSLFLGARYKLEDNQAIKLNIDFAWVSSSDAGSKNAKRNYKSNSFFAEQSVQYEYSIIKDNRRQFSFALFNRRGMINNYSKMNLYVFAGLGSLIYKPWFTGKLIPNDTAINKIGITMVFPAGIGLKIILSYRYSVGFELGGRYTLSHTLDGLDTKQFNKHNNVYYLGSINLVYRIRTSIRGYPVLRGHSYY